MQGRVKGSLSLFAVSVVILCIPWISIADQSSALLDLAALANNTLIGWNPSNISRLCEWQYVSCDAENRVVKLQLDGDDERNIPLLVGSIPQSIANLTSLRSLFLQHNYIYGDFPSSIFLLPNISYVFLHNTGLTVSFPPNISSSIQNLNVAHTKIVSPIPEAKWDQMQIFDFEATGIQCPLPAGFVSHFRSGGSMIECSMYMNNLTIDQNNMVCGQIPSSNTTCRIAPAAYRAQYFPTDDTVLQSKIFSTRLLNFTLEFTQDEILIFTTYSRRGVVKEYRREYLSFKLMPIGDTYGADFQRKFETLDRPYWNRSAIIVEPNRVRANTTNTNSLVTEFIFDSIIDRGEIYIKVSLIVYNLGHRWIPEPTRKQKVSLYYIFNIRVSHSPAQGQALSCVRGLFGSSSCSSNVSTVDTFIDFNSRSSVVKVRTRTAEIVYKYYIEGSVDGYPLYSNNASIFAPRLPFPLPSSRWLEANFRGGFNVTSNNFTDADQTFCVPIELLVPEFQDKFFFDPDISITLLFDPSDNLAPESSDPDVKVASSVGLIVGLVVGGVVFIAAITLFATVVFPYMKQRNEAKMNAEPLEEANESADRPQQRGWIKSNKPKPQ